MPGPSSRTLRRYIADSPVTATSAIQVQYMHMHICHYSIKVCTCIHCKYKKLPESMYIHIIQGHVLDEAKSKNPDAWWWIKADDICDILPGIAESTQGVWSGDVDLDNSDLEEQKAAYRSRLSRIDIAYD